MKRIFSIVALCLPLFVMLSCGDDEEKVYTTEEDYVDLGLSVMWATKNIGATSVTDFGYYYAWGETASYEQKDSTNTTLYTYNLTNGVGYVKRYYGWETYKYCDSIKETMTKYNYDPEFGKVDDIYSLSPDDDAAIVHLGGKWRMPTHEECSELVKKCYWMWTSNYHGSGIAGYIVFKAKSADDMGVVTNGRGYTNSGADGKQVTYKMTTRYSMSDTHIFLPAAGARHHSYHYGYSGQVDENGNENEMVGGYYWSRSLNELRPDGAYAIYINQDSRYGMRSQSRFYGCTIRPVF